MTQAAQTVAASEHEDLLCKACGHRVQDHDATAARYCVATEASGISVASIPLGLRAVIPRFT